MSPAQAGSTTIYRWTTADGALGFADDMKRVPKEYRDQVQKKTIKSLSGYAKLTLEDTATRTKRMEELNARIAYLEEMNHTLDQIRREIDAPAVSARGGQGVSIFSGQVSGYRGGAVGGISIPVDSDSSGGPIVTEQVRMYDPHSMTTRTNTITHQDGRIISVRRPRAIRQSLSEIQDEPQY